jgi:hypothetical protein
VPIGRHSAIELYLGPFVDGKTTFLEDLGSCVSPWKNPSRTRECKWDLLKVRKGKYKGGHR